MFIYFSYLGHFSVILHNRIQNSAQVFMHQLSSFLWYRSVFKMMMMSSVLTAVQIAHHEFVLQTALSHKNEPTCWKLVWASLQLIAQNSVLFWYINEKCFVNRGPGSVVYLSSICEETICINNCGCKGDLNGMWYLLSNFVYKEKFHLLKSKSKKKDLFFHVLYQSDQHVLCRLLMDFSLHLNVA